MLTKDERAELEALRASAHRFMTSSLERAFFDLECLVDRPPSNRVDAIMPSSAFYVLAKALLELKRSIK